MNRGIKNECRAQLKAAREAILPDERVIKEERACEKLLKFLDGHNFERVMAYMSFGAELKTSLVIERLREKGIIICLPRCSGRDICPYDFFMGDPLEKSRIGVSEPFLSQRVIEKELISACIVPGLGFDFDGGRLGYGMGYYDRFLRGFSGLKIGYCFDEQMCETPLPREACDVNMNCIITDKRVVLLAAQNTD